MDIWLIILGMALVTFLPRVLPLVALRAEDLPPSLQKGLRYVPIAVLSAIVAASYLPSEDWLRFTLDERLLAGLIAIGVAWYSKSTLLTISFGMLALLLLGQVWP
jgi:branched-subunit amino acid transport protein